jgi:hypothetical protein
MPLIGTQANVNGNNLLYTCTQTLFAYKGAGFSNIIFKKRHYT